MAWRIGLCENWDARESGCSYSYPDVIGLYDGNRNSIAVGGCDRRASGYDRALWRTILAHHFDSCKLNPEVEDYFCGKIGECVEAVERQANEAARTAATFDAERKRLVDTVAQEAEWTFLSGRASETAEMAGRLAEEARRLEQDARHFPQLWRCSTQAKKNSFEAARLATKATREIEKHTTNVAELRQTEIQRATDQGRARLLEIASEIESLLGCRGFDVGTAFPDATRTDYFIWPRAKNCWEQFGWQHYNNDVWCLALEKGGGIYFGVHEQVIRAATARTTGASINGFMEWARSSPHFPESLRLTRFKAKRDGSQYWALPLGTTGGVEAARALIVEIVNAFVIHMTGGKPWGTVSTVEGVAEPGVPCLQTKKMPDPNETPHNSLTLMAQDILPQLGREYEQNNNDGSVSWNPPNDRVQFTLCHFGPHDWLFGVNRDLVNDNPCLQRLVYDCTFHIKPVTQNSRAVYRGFPVFDTLASYERIKEVLDCCQ